LSSVVIEAFVRALGTVLAALIALPIVAWLEGLRGRSAPTASPGVVNGPRGALTALAAAIKLLEKRAPRAPGADRLLHTTAPILALVPTLSVLAVIPLSPVDPVAATLPFLLALLLVSTGAIALAGYSGGSSLAHLAGLRLVALRLSVLVVIAACALAPAHAAATVDLLGLVAAQAQPLIGPIPRWGAIVAPTSFLAALLAFAIHAQHVLRARTEPSLADTWLGDAIGPVLLGHRVFESLDLVAGACVLAVVFLGGWHLPGLPLPFAVASILKVALALIAIVVARNTLPALTPAVALRVCWIVLLPMAVLGLVVLAVLS
jgi:NADH-quinone oxidoreductase subunit H